MSAERVQKVLKKKCPLCPDVVDPKGVNAHFRNRHPEEAKKWSEWKDKFEDVEVEVPIEEEGPPKPPEIQMIEEATQFVSERLKQVYGISEGYKKIVVNALEDDPSALRDGNLLHGFVKNLAPRAYDAHLSTTVIKPLYIRFPGLPQAVTQYLAGLQPATPQMFYQPTWSPQAQPWGYPSTAGGMVDQYGRMTQPMVPPRRMKVVVDGQEIYTDLEGYMAHQRYRRDEADDKRRADEHDLRMKRLEADILKITRETGGGSERGLYEEVTEYIDAEGKICDPDTAVSVRIKRTPMDRETKGITTEEVRRIVREGREELTAEKVREIVRDETRPEESQAMRDLSARLDKTIEDYEALKEQMSSEERARLSATITKLEDRIETIRGEVGRGEYKEDTFRMLDSSVKELSSILRGKQPLETLKDILLPGATTPSSEMAGESERGGVIHGLRKHGLVTRIRER